MCRAGGHGNARAKQVAHLASAMVAKKPISPRSSTAAREEALKLSARERHNGLSNGCCPTPLFFAYRHTPRGPADADAGTGADSDAGTEKVRLREQRQDWETRRKRSAPPPHRRGGQDMTSRCVPTKLTCSPIEPSGRSVKQPLIHSASHICSHPRLRFALCAKPVGHLASAAGAETEPNIPFFCPVRTRRGTGEAPAHGATAKRRKGRSSSGILRLSPWTPSRFHSPISSIAVRPSPSSSHPSLLLQLFRRAATVLGCHTARGPTGNGTTGNTETGAAKHSESEGKGESRIGRITAERGEQERQDPQRLLSREA